MASQVQIFNMALGELGADQIADPQQLTGTAKVVAARYDDVVDSVLRAHPWNCAIRRARLAAMAEAPLHGYARQFRLPVDPFCLRPLELVGFPKDKWVVEGRFILTDLSGPLPLRYIARLSNPDEFDALLTQAIVKRLAAVCAWRITKKENGESLLRQYKEVLNEARAVDGQEGWPDEPDFESEILAARA